MRSSSASYILQLVASIAKEKEGMKRVYAGWNTVYIIVFKQGLENSKPICHPPPFPYSSQGRNKVPANNLPLY
jgi:hypothetical protein